MGPNCMETYIRLYGFLPVWFGWKRNPGLERMGEVEMGRGQRKGRPGGRPTSFSHTIKTAARRGVLWAAVGGQEMAPSGEQVKVRVMDLVVLPDLKQAVP